MFSIRNFVINVFCFFSIFAPVISNAEPMPANFDHWYGGVDFGFNWGNIGYSTNSICAPIGTDAVYCSFDIPDSVANNNAVINTGFGNLSPTNFTINIEAGRNWQKGSFVFGSEADFGVFNFNSSALAQGFFPFTFLGDQFSLTHSISTDWLATLRGRLGLLIKGTRLLFYGTGGAAFTHFRASTSYSDNAIGQGFPGGSGYNSRNSTVTGWVLGAGSEFLVNPHCSFKIEYLYMDFGSMNYSVFLTNTPDYTQTIRPSFTLRAQLVRLGINYLF